MLLVSIFISFIFCCIRSVLLISFPSTSLSFFFSSFVFQFVLLFFSNFSRCMFSFLIYKVDFLKIAVLDSQQN